MGGNRKTYSENFKTEVALAALKENRAVNGIATEYQIAPSMVTKRKKGFISERQHGPKEFAEMQKRLDELTRERDNAYLEVGKQRMMIDLMKKKLRIED